MNVRAFFMRAVEIIQKKRDGGVNTPDEIAYLVQNSLEESVPRYQVAAWLMAIYFQGLNESETAALTSAILDSGTTVKHPSSQKPRIDKHSTGGVGDKTSLVIAPIAAALGVDVPMISGRGLGHTGGTLDKLEAIPGFRTDLSLPRFLEGVESHGLCLIGQTPELAPADRFLYSLRDVTATVESIPLIVSSIISKKVAEGIDGLVLDVKTGSGAFMKELDDSLVLARALVTAARGFGKKVVAVISAMDQPLGLTIGNALEVREAMQTLQGDGPADFRELCLTLAGHMIVLGGRAEGLEQGVDLAGEQISNGAALQRFRDVIEFQAGNPEIVENPDLLPAAQHRQEFLAQSEGYISELRADLLGTAAMVLGAGRNRLDDLIDPAVGIELHHKIGGQVSHQEPLLTVHYRDTDRLEAALPWIRKACCISREPPAMKPLIRTTVS